MTAARKMEKALAKIAKALADLGVTPGPIAPAVTPQPQRAAT